MHMLLQESMRGFPSIARYPALADIGLRGRTNQSSLTHSMLLKLLMLTHSFFPHSGAKDFFPAPSSIPLTKPGGGIGSAGTKQLPRPARATPPLVQQTRPPVPGLHRHAASSDASGPWTDRGGGGPCEGNTPRITGPWGGGGSVPGITFGSPGSLIRPGSVWQVRQNMLFFTYTNGGSVVGFFL